MKDIKLKIGETIIPIENLKAVELGPNDTLILETDVFLGKYVKDKLENVVSKKLCGKILVLDGGIKTKAIIKGVSK